MRLFKIYDLFGKQDIAIFFFHDSRGTHRFSTLPAERVLNINRERQLSRFLFVHTRSRKFTLYSHARGRKSRRPRRSTFTPNCRKSKTNKLKKHAKTIPKSSRNYYFFFFFCNRTCSTRTHGDTNLVDPEPPNAAKQKKQVKKTWKKPTKILPQLLFFLLFLQPHMQHSLARGRKSRRPRAPKSQKVILPKMGFRESQFQNSSKVFRAPQK